MFLDSANVCLNWRSSFYFYFK